MATKKINLVAFSVALFFAACGDDNSSANTEISDSEDISVSVNEVTGVSQKGPFLMGSKVQMFEVSNGRSLNQTGKSFNGKISNDKGEFKIKGSKLCSQYVILEASGYYRNENTGKNSKSELTLLAISNVSNRNTININLLTHLEYERVDYLVTQQKMKVDDAKKQAQKEILEIFGIDNTKFSNSEDLNIAGTNDEDGALLAISVLLQGDRNESQFSELLTKLAIDMEEDGEWNDDAQKNAIADWAAEIVHSGRIVTIRSNVEKWQLSDIVPNFEKYINIFWWHTYGLGECSANREGEVLQNTNAQSTKYGTYYICKEGLWREATAIEYDTYQWKAETDGAVRLGNVIKTNCYVYEDQAWRNGNASDCSLGLRGCTALRQDTVGKGNDKVWYICDEKSWRNATTYEKDTFGWKDSTDGTIKKGNVTDTTYLFDGSAWRTRSDVEKKLGGCVKVIEDSVGTVDGKEYYICKSNNWVEASEIEYDTYRWAAGKDGEIKKGNITDNIYIFDKNAWRTADNIEAVLGGCVAATQDSLGKVDEFYYICKSNKWEIASADKYDTLNMVCSKNGSLMHGKIEHENLYVCDKGVFRPADSIETALDGGCTSYNEGSISRKSKITDYICKSSRWVQFFDSISYDGQIYHIVRIGDQTWFADNLNYADSLSTLDLRGNSWCYDDDVENCKKYGRLYTWTAAMNIAKEYQRKSYKPKDVNQGICPSGWHIPSKEEAETLYHNTSETFSLMIVDSTDYWDIAMRPHSFNMSPSGWRPFGNYEDLGGSGYLWTSTVSNHEYAYQIRLRMPGSGDIADYYKEVGYSVRCIKDLGNSSSGTNVKPGACTSAIEDSVRKIDENFYVCTSNKWIKMTTTQYDTYKEKCSKFGQITHGTYNTDNVYFCNGNEWKLFNGNENITFEKLVDERDGQIYRTVEIGGQTWMAENLNYADSSTILSLKGRNWCYNNKPEICTETGRLYTWSAAIDSIGLYNGGRGVNCGYSTTCSLPAKVQGICPSGWHLPTYAEWDILFKEVGGPSIAGKILKSQRGWSDGGNGTDNVGFSAVPVGEYVYEGFGNDGKGTTFLSATEAEGRYAYIMYLRATNDDARMADDGKHYGYSVRCIKDGSVSSMIEYDTYQQKCTEFGQIIHGKYNTDSVYFCNGKKWKRFYGNENITYGKLVDERDNQVYRTVKIGDQTWMAENLNYADSSTTPSLKRRSWCYNNEPENCTIAGRLYTWAAAIDSVGLYAGGKGMNCGYTETCSLPDTVYGICPPGWHLPNKGEWKTLIDRALDSEFLKSQVGWPVNYNGNDAYGFSILPGGVLYRSLGFEENGSTAFIWTSSEEDYDPNSSAIRFYIHNNSILLSGEQKIDGCSIRCIKNEE